LNIWPNPAHCLEIMTHSDSDSPNAELQKELSPPPDGGLLAWSQVLAGHLINTVTWGYATGFGVFQTYYEQTLPVSASAISWIGGIQIFLCFAIGTISGRGTDAGLARPIVLCGSILLVLGTFMTSLCTQYWQVFLAQGVCVGLGLGMTWLPSVTLIATYFKRKRVLAVTISAAGASTGSMIFPAIIQYLTPNVGQ
jgi:MFS family permease